MAEYAREPRAYELMVILLPELAEDDLTAAIDRVSTYVTDVTGGIREILKDSPWGRRRLAYTIRFNGQDYRDGFYVIWHFTAEPSQLGDLERELKLDTRVVRYLLVLEDPKWNSPQEREAARELANAPAETEAEIVAEVVEAEEIAEVVEAVEEAEAIVEAEEIAEEVEAIVEAEEVAEVIEAVEEAEAEAVAEEVAEEIAEAEEVAEVEAIVEEVVEEAAAEETSDKA